MTEAADTGFERRLIERIALKEAVAQRLDKRERRVLCARLEGYTQREVAGRLGISTGRAYQLEGAALRRLKLSTLGLRDNVPLPGPPDPPQVSTVSARFDRAAFLAHMRLLIRRRATAGERERAAAFEHAREQLSHMVAEQDAADEMERRRKRHLAERQWAAAKEQRLRAEEQRLFREQAKGWFVKDRLGLQRRVAAVLVDVRFGDEALRQRAAWIGRLSACYGWDLTMKWVAEYDARAEADRQRMAGEIHQLLGHDAKVPA